MVSQNVPPSLKLLDEKKNLCDPGLKKRFQIL